MANKPFEIQGSTLTIGGVDLEAGTTGVVIPGVTQATNYRVEEVEDTGDQTQTLNPATAVVVDFITYDQISAGLTPDFTADYTVELDEEGYIDEIQVNGRGTYNSYLSGLNESNDMYAYIGAGSASDRPVVVQDWIQVPFRPKMRAGDIETIGGGGGGSGTINKVYYQYSTDIILSVNTEENSVTVGGDITNSLNDAEYVSLSVVPPQAQLAAEWEYDSGNNQTTIIFNSEDVEIQSGYVGEEVRTIYVYNNPTSLIFDDTVATYQTGGVVSIHGTPTQLFKGGESLAIMDTGDVILDGQGPGGGVNRGIEWKYGENESGVNSKIRQDQAGLTVRAWTESGGDIAASVNIVTNQDANQKTWEFNGDGVLIFPDGSQQTTAYTGQSGSGAGVGRFVMINQEGTVTGSSDGLNWGTLFDTGLNILSRVAVGPDDIVYTGPNLSTYHTTDWNVTPTLVSDTGSSLWNQVRYFNSLGRFVAVGKIDNVPAYKHSVDGLTWTVVQVDTGWSSTLNGGSGPGPAEFTDIATNGTGFLISSNNTVLGSFYTTTLTTNTNLGSAEWLNDGMKFDQILYTPMGDFTGWWGFGEGNTGAGDGWWHNSATNPADGSFTTNWGGMGDISAAFLNIIGYEPMWSEIASGQVNGVDTIVIATGNGQVMYWPILPAGPYVSIPKPFTCTVTDMTWNGSATYVTLTGDNTSYTNGEKVTISGSSVTGYNGTYYIRDGAVYLDQAGTQPFDSSGLASFTGTATMTFSHGMFIDALNYVNGKFYVGNDSEEIFVSSNGGATWTEVASLTGPAGVGENLGYMNDMDGYILSDASITSMSYYDSNLDYNSTVVLTGDFNVDVKYAHADFNGDGSWNIGSNHYNTTIYTANNTTTDPKDIIVEAGGKPWQFDSKGSLTFPDDTVQKTAFPDFNRSWATIIGDGVNDAGTDNDYGSSINMTTVYAMPDGSVVAGGSWTDGNNALLFHFDKNGRELWRWMDVWNGYAGSSDSRVSSITYDSVNEKLVVAVYGRWGQNSSYNYSTMVFKFTRHPENFGKWNYWVCDNAGGSDSVSIRDNDMTGNSEVYQILTQNGNIVALGETWGDKFEAYAGSAVSGSGVGIISIAKVDITPYNGQYPDRDNAWSITYNGGTYDLNWNNLGRYTAVPWTTNNSGAGAELQVYINYNAGTYTVQLTGGTLTGWVTGDVITILGTDLGGASPANDLTVTVTDDGYGSIYSLGTPTGTANTDYIRINQNAWFADTEDHSATGYTYTLTKPVNSEAFILNDYDEWAKRLSTDSYGRFQAGVFNSDENAWFIGGESWDYVSSPTLSLSLTRLNRSGNVVWSKSLVDRASNVAGIADTGTSLWTVDLNGIVMEFDYNGTLLYQSEIDENEYGMNYDYGTTNIKYVNGYIYIGGHINTWGWGNDQIRVEKIDPVTKQVVWCRHIKSRFANVQYDQGRYKYMDANESGVFVIGQGYMGANDNRRNGFIIKLDLDNPPGADVDYLDNKSEPNLNGWFIFDKYDGSYFKNWRVTPTRVMTNRTNDQWLSTEIVSYGGENISQQYPRWSLRHTSIDAKGFSFNDNTGELRHNPAYVPPIETEWVNNDYEYTLKLEDAGKFIRNIAYDSSNCTVYVPNESQVNFPIGTVITLINMYDWSNNNTYMYINAQSDPDGQDFDGYDRAFVYLAGEGNGYSNSWGLKGVGTATLMKVGRNEWLLTGNCVNTD